LENAYLAVTATRLWGLIPDTTGYSSPPSKFHTAFTMTPEFGGGLRGCRVWEILVARWAALTCPVFDRRIRGEPEGDGFGFLL
jgi:hypothetical protein